MNNRIKAMASAGMAVLFLSTATGCSAFRSSTQQLAVTCIPEDAMVMINGQRYNSPASVRVKRDRDISIQCYKEGYVPYQRTIGNHFNETGALDAVGTVCFLLPGIGLFCSGAWSLDETDVTVTLFQK